MQRVVWRRDWLAYIIVDMREIRGLSAEVTRGNLYRRISKLLTFFKNLV